MNGKFDALMELRGKGERVTELELAIVTLWQEMNGYETLAAKAATELAVKDEAVEAGIKALRAVIHDRPTAHRDEVWQMVNDALEKLETLK